MEVEEVYEKWRETIPQGLVMPDGVGDTVDDFSVSKASDWDSDRDT